MGGRYPEYSPPKTERQSRQGSISSLNQTLTSLQLEKKRLEGEYSKIRFSQASTRKDIRSKKMDLEAAMTIADSRINNVKSRLRELKLSTWKKE